MVSVWLLIGRENDANFTRQTQSGVKQDQRKREITFDTHLKTVLLRGQLAFPLNDAQRAFLVTV